MLDMFHGPIIDALSPLGTPCVRKKMETCCDDIYCDWLLDSKSRSQIDISLILYVIML